MQERPPLFCRNIEFVQLLGTNGTLWQTTAPRPDASRRLKALKIKPHPAILDLD